MPSRETNGSANGSDLEGSSPCFLLTGAVGLVASRTAARLLNEGFKVVVIIDGGGKNADSNGDSITDLALQDRRNLNLFKADLRQRDAVEKIFSLAKFDAVLHFAELQGATESAEEPLLYYDKYLVGTINLLDVMATHGCKKLVFSSSTTVQGQPESGPCTNDLSLSALKRLVSSSSVIPIMNGQPESIPCATDLPLSALHHYSRTKLYIEEICRDVQKADTEWKIIFLHYFNPVGAYAGGLSGEDHRAIPNNIIPDVQQGAVGKHNDLITFGNGSASDNGTEQVQDYIHVTDPVEGHITVLQKLSTMI